MLEPSRRWGLEKQSRAKQYKLEEAEKEQRKLVFVGSKRRGDLEVLFIVECLQRHEQGLGSIPQHGKEGGRKEGQAFLWQ